jgi:hypothetical protein
LDALKPHYFSRSAGDTDDNCPRARYWNTVYGGRGLESTEPKEALLFGTEMHRGLQTIWETGNLKVQEFFQTGFPEDLAWVGRGLLYAYYSTVYRRYQLEGWKLLHAEQECKAHLGFSPGGRELILLAQPDLLIQHESTGLVRYVEAKTTKVLDAAFMESWRYAPQLAAGFEAVWQTLGIQVDDFVMQLFYKGTFYKDEGRWASVFTSAWRRVKKGFQVGLLKEKLDFDDYEWSPKRPTSWKGWERVDLPGTVDETVWHEFLLKHGALEEQCPETPPLIFHKGMVEAWIEQKKLREGEIADWDSHDDIIPAHVPTTFPQKFLKCKPYNGFPCNYLSLCWNPTETKQPLLSGRFKWREPHHKTEAEALDGTESSA